MDVKEKHISFRQDAKQLDFHINTRDTPLLKRCFSHNFFIVVIISRSHRCSLCFFLFTQIFTITVCFLTRFGPKVKLKSNSVFHCIYYADKGFNFKTGIHITWI